MPVEREGCRYYYQEFIHDLAEDYIQKASKVGDQAFKVVVSKSSIDNHFENAVAEISCVATDAASEEFCKDGLDRSIITDQHIWHEYYDVLDSLANQYILDNPDRIKYIKEAVAEARESRFEGRRFIFG